MEPDNHHDQILPIMGSRRSSGLHPLLIPHVIRSVLESSQLSVDDLKNCRLVCTDWSTHARPMLSKKCRITIKYPSEMCKFIETFIAGQYIPSQDFKLVESEDLITDFSPLLDWPGLEIESLILNNCDGDAGPSTYPWCYDRIGNFLDVLSPLLKKTGNIKHLAFQYWTFTFMSYQNPNDLDTAIENGSKVKTLALNNCVLSEAAARVLLPTFNTIFPELETIDFSNLDSNYDSFRTNILPETLVRSFTWSRIKTLKIPTLNKEVIDGLGRNGIKLKHFHADDMWTRHTSIVTWKTFWSQQNELESFSINNLHTKGNCLGPIGYRIPRMKKLRRLHIGGNGLRCLVERDQIFESCPNLNELIVGYLPADLMITNHQITSLTLENPDVWYCDWLKDLTSISIAYAGLKYLTVKVQPSLDMVDMDSPINLLSNFFPNLIDLKIIKTNIVQRPELPNHWDDDDFVDSVILYVPRTLNV